MSGTAIVCRYCDRRQDDPAIDPWFCRSSRRNDRQHAWDEVQIEDANLGDTEDDEELEDAQP